MADVIFFLMSRYLRVIIEIDFWRNLNVHALYRRGIV